VPHEIGPTRLEVENVTASPMPQNVTFSLRRGEIFGVAGLVGAGRTELMRCLFGIEPTYNGHVRLDGQRLPHNVRGRRKAGFGLLSEDRKSEGLAQDLSITENLSMGNHDRYTTAGWLNLKSRLRDAKHWIKKVEIKAHSPNQAVSELSGGNQQKVALARLLAQDAEIYLLDEPTKGIDVGTKAEIYRMIGELASRGKTVIFVSSYLPELLAVCDTIGVMTRGRLTETRSASQWDEETLMNAALAAVDDER
jgi:ribose transport system ATP-binding protein